jgi:hypothetical protein
MWSYSRGGRITEVVATQGTAVLENVLLVSVLLGNRFKVDRAFHIFQKKRNRLKKIRSVHMTAMSAYMLSQR